MQSPRRKLACWMVVLICMACGLALQKIGLNIRLAGLGSQEILKNGDFSHALASWFSSSQSYYLPWHIDNVYLELLLFFAVQMSRSRALDAPGAGKNE